MCFKKRLQVEEVRQRYATYSQQSTFRLTYYYSGILFLLCLLFLANTNKESWTKIRISSILRPPWSDLPALNSFMVELSHLLSILSTNLDKILNSSGKTPFVSQTSERNEIFLQTRLIYQWICQIETSKCNKEVFVWFTLVSFGID